MSRLQSIAPQLAHRLGASSPTANHRVSRLAAEFAVSTSGVSHAELLRLFDRLCSEQQLDSTAANKLTNIVESLDEAAGQIQDKVEAGTASPDEYVVAFDFARGAAAVAYAVAGNASEAVYEASATIDDPESLWALVDGALATS